MHGEISRQSRWWRSTLLETAEQGEDATKKTYKEALEGEIPFIQLSETLRRQQVHIQISLN